MPSTPSTLRPRGWPPCSIGSTSHVSIRISPAFRKPWGSRRKVARGPHVILLHQHSDAEADERIALLERVITGYHLLVRRPRRELDGPAQAAGLGLVCRSERLPGLSPSEDADAFATTRGYFHPTWNAVVAYDARSSDPQRTAREKLAAKRDELQRFREMVDQAPRGAGSRSSSPTSRRGPSAEPRRRRSIARSDDEITCETMLLDLDWRSVDLGTAAHEMIHQLASDSGLVPRHDTFPGLAARRAWPRNSR